jgi:LppX_LprAFG lipoprotein
MRRTVAVLLALPLVAAACGGGGKSSSVVKLTPVAYVHSAAEKTAAQPSEHVAIAVSAVAGSQEVRLSGGGDFDSANRLGQIHFDVNAGPLSSTMDGIYSGTSFYLKSPLVASALPGGKTWLKVDLEQAAKAKGLDLSTLAGQDPSKSLAQLQSLGNVSAVGSETIGGVATTHYRGELDPSKLAGAAKLPQLATAAPIPYDVWIGDDDGYVRKVTSHYSLQRSGTTATVSLDETFSSFGEHVSVTVPPATDVYDATNLAINGTGG